MLWLWLGLALAGPGELREARVAGLEVLASGERPLTLAPMRRQVLGRHFVDGEGAIYARSEVYDLLEAADPTHMGRYWRQRRRAHRWATIMVLIPPPWGFGAVAAHFIWRGRAADELERALEVYNTMGAWP